jgi:riboflavin synthase
VGSSKGDTLTAMFAGIVEKTSRIVSAQDRLGIRRVRIKTPTGWRVKIGQSVAIDGVCSTVAMKLADSFVVEYMPETLSKTTAGSLEKNRVVNLERSLTLKSFVDGHLVQGHVDGRVSVVGVHMREGVHNVVVALPRNLQRFVALHGSIAINGVALTVAARGKSTCTVALIPNTIVHTNLGSLKKGDAVNIETDLVARYLAALKRA